MSLSTIDPTKRKHLKVKKAKTDPDRERNRKILLNQVTKTPAPQVEVELCSDTGIGCNETPFHGRCYLCLIKDGSYELAYAFFFENLVVYGSIHDFLNFLNGSQKKKLGEFLGVVKAVVPRDPYRVAYEWIKHTEGFKKREKQRRGLAKVGLSMRKMRHMKKHLGQKELSSKL